MLVLRDFQLDCVNEADELGVACLIAATGSGKTMMGAALAWREINRKGRVAFVVPRDNLARQTAGTLSRWGLTSGYILGGERENRSAQVQIVSYQSLGSKKRSLDWLGDRTTLWLVDECHITAFAASLQPYLDQDIRKIGLTATPWQMDVRRSLLDIFQNPVFAPPPGELIKRGYLAKPIYFRPRLARGKLDPSPEFILEQWLEFSEGERTFIFCDSIASSDATANCFTANGINAISVTSKTPFAKVESSFDAFRKGEALCLVSCNKLAEGCDIPSATSVILASRTDSMSALFQRIGRGARIAPGKKVFKVIDCVGLTRKFGRFEDIIITHADFDSCEPEGGKKPEKQCENCQAWCHISATVCDNCGSPFEIKGTPRVSPGQLERLTSSEQEGRAIANFHSLLLQDFRQGTTKCESEFLKIHGYLPLDHWVVDCELPTIMRSGSVNAAWREFKKSVRDRLPKDSIQLKLPF